MMVAILTVDIVFDLTENELFDLAFDQNKFLVHGINALIEQTPMRGHMSMVTVWNPYEKGCGRFHGNSYY